MSEGMLCEIACVRFSGPGCRISSLSSPLWLFSPLPRLRQLGHPPCGKLKLGRCGQGNRLGSERLGPGLLE